MPARVEQIIPALRAALATQLAYKYKLKKSHIARALGVSPAAITQYITGSRGQRLAAWVQPEEIDALAERIARKITLGMIESATAELTSFLNKLIAPRAAQLPATGTRVDATIISKLAERVTLEEEAAKRALDLAASANSILAKMILKQMATDSIRHSEILTTLIHIIENNEDTTLPSEDIALIAEMYRFEDAAEEQKLSELPITEISPAIRALLTSIDIDEQKHETLLKTTIPKK